MSEYNEYNEYNEYDEEQNMEHTDEITLRDLMLLIQKYQGVLWREKLHIIVAGVIAELAC